MATTLQINTTRVYPFPWNPSAHGASIYEKRDCFLPFQITDIGFDKLQINASLNFVLRIAPALLLF
jgi:hypothetical protein